MPRFAKHQISWGIIVTVLLAAASWVGSGMMAAKRYGAEMEQKVDREELNIFQKEIADEFKEHEQDYSDHKERQARVEGEITGALKAIRSDLEYIKGKM